MRGGGERGGRNMCCYTLILSPLSPLSLPVSVSLSLSFCSSIPLCLSLRHPPTLIHTFTRSHSFTRSLLFFPLLVVSLFVSSQSLLSISPPHIPSRSLRHLHLSQPAVRVRQTPFDVIVVHRQPHHLRQVAKRRRKAAGKALIGCLEVFGGVWRC